MTIIDNLVRTIKASGKDTFSQNEILEILIPQERLALTKGNITIDPKTYTIIVDGKSQKVARKIFELSYYFLENKNIAIKKSKILYDVWGNNVIVDHRTVDVHVRAIRKILGNGIKTFKGNGYGWMDN